MKKSTCFQSWYFSEQLGALNWRNGETRPQRERRVVEAAWCAGFESAARLFAEGKFGLRDGMNRGELAIVGTPLPLSALCAIGEGLQARFGDGVRVRPLANAVVFECQGDADAAGKDVDG